jgi:hypothetical protein
MAFSLLCIAFVVIWRRYKKHALGRGAAKNNKLMER